MMSSKSSPLISAIFNLVETRPDKIAIVGVDGTEVSYSQLKENILRGALFLKENGLKKATGFYFQLRKKWSSSIFILVRTSWESSMSWLTQKVLTND